MTVLSSERIHAIINHTPTPLKEGIATALLGRHERNLMQDNSRDMFRSNNWYYINRDPKRRNDHAKMSLEERTWFLLDAKTEHRDRWIAIMATIRNMGAFEATKHLGDLKASHKRSYMQFQKYLSNLESSASSQNYAAGKELASTQTREELFILCRTATKGFTIDIPIDSPLHEQILLASELESYRTGTLYKNVPPILSSSL